MNGRMALAQANAALGVTVNMDSTDGNKCPICDKHAEKLCSACKSVFYCSVEHQKHDWKKHKKKNCRSYAIETNDKYGRYVVAAKDIPAGAIIMQEEPIMYGPKQDTLPICLACHKLLMMSGSKYYCSKCKFPMCGPACEKVAIHADNECSLFSQSKHSLIPKVTNFNQPTPIYECILTLRLLNLKKLNPNKWKQLIQMTHQNENRRELLPAIWHRNQANTVQTLRKIFGEEFTEMDIHSVIGYIDINAFEVKLNGYDISGLFNNTYVMSHDCVSNTHHTFTDNCQMIVRSSLPIKKGQQITTSYASTLDGTLNRLVELYESKLFECTCARCIDPTECGTYLSAIKCNNANCGLIEDAYLLPKDPQDLESVWLCNRCSSGKNVQNVKKLTDLIQEEIRIEEETNAENAIIITNLESMLKKYEKRILHPNHYLIVQILHSLVSLYGRINGWLVHQLSLTQLTRMEDHCFHLIGILDSIEPGLSRLRGFALYQLHAAIYFKSQKELQNGAINYSEFTERLNKVLELLKESHTILSFDGEHTPEGRIARSIPQSISNVEDTLLQLLRMPNSAKKLVKYS